MRTIPRTDWQRANRDQDIRRARETSKRADLPASVLAALVAYEGVVERRNDNAAALRAYGAAAIELARLVMVVDNYVWPHAVARSRDDLQRAHNTGADIHAHTLALAGTCWRVYRTEKE